MGQPEHQEVLVYFCSQLPESPWIIKHRDLLSSDQWSEIRVSKVSFWNPAESVVIDEQTTSFGIFAIKTDGYLTIGVQPDGKQVAVIE